MALVKCKECGKEISSSVAKCPSCGANRKNWFARHPFLTGIGGLIILIIIISIASGGNDSKKVGSQDSGTQTEDKVYNVGDQVQLGKAVVTVNSVETSNGGTYTKPSAGNKWVNLNITIENTDSSQQFVTTMGQMFLKDSAGNSYQVAVTDKVMDSPNNSLDGSIVAKSKRTGWVGFEVGGSATGLQFQYNGSIWGGGNILVNLGK